MNDLQFIAPGISYVCIFNKISVFKNLKWLRTKLCSENENALCVCDWEVIESTNSVQTVFDVSEIVKQILLDLAMKN